MNTTTLRITRYNVMYAQVCALLAGLCLLSSLQGQTTLYEENFLNTSGTTVILATYGWVGYKGATATSISAANVFIAPGDGNPNDTKGYLAATNNTSMGLAMYESFSAIDLADGTITFSMGNQSTSTVVRLLIQNGGNWYASSQTFANTTAYNATSFSTTTTSDVRRSYAFSTAAANWMTFTLNPGTSMSLGSIAGSNLASSSITALGFYAELPASSPAVRLDTVTATVPVPEPTSTAVLLGAGTLLGVIFIRRLRRNRQG